MQSILVHIIFIWWVFTHLVQMHSLILRHREDGGSAHLRNHGTNKAHITRRKSANDYHHLNNNNNNNNLKTLIIFLVR